MNRQFLKVMNVLATGKPVKRAEINKRLSRTVVMSRLSTYLWNARQAGAKLKVIKDGRNVVAIQLLNPKQLAIKLKPAPGPGVDRLASLAKSKSRAKPKAKPAPQPTA